LSQRKGIAIWRWHKRGDFMSDIILNPDEREVFRLFTNYRKKGLTAKEILKHVEEKSLKISVTNLKTILNTLIEEDYLCKQFLPKNSQYKYVLTEKGKRELDSLFHRGARGLPG
jgi:predicted transcriptional regulator